MNDMFAYCVNLVSINLSNFDTSKVSNMQGAFSTCQKIKYINFQYFNDTSLSNNNLLFSGCSNLLYLNLRSFMKIKYHANTNLLIYPFYFEAPSNIKFCIEDLRTKNKVIGDKTNDCSDFVFKKMLFLILIKASVFAKKILNLNIITLVIKIVQLKLTEYFKINIYVLLISQKIFI